jgi:hypothetical protein
LASSSGCILAKSTLFPSHLLSRRTSIHQPDNLLHRRGGEVCTWELGIYGKCRRMPAWPVAAVIADRLTDNRDEWEIIHTSSVVR